jgi:hypothetical protein
MILLILFGREREKDPTVYSNLGATRAIILFQHSALVMQSPASDKPIPLLLSSPTSPLGPVRLKKKTNLTRSLLKIPIHRQAAERINARMCGR